MSTSISWIECSKNRHVVSLQDWYLHMSSVNRAIDLCFVSDRINYKRWLPIYYEDCLALPQRFPKMHSSFVKGDFVVRHTQRRGSAVPVDQALEKAYKKPAKSSDGIIGFTRRKEAVCKWNLIKHEKAKYRSHLYDVCQMADDEDQYSLHYEFSERTSKSDSDSVKSLMRNIKQRGNPFDLEQPSRIRNIATGAILEKSNEEFLLNFSTLAKTAREDFYQSRLIEKSKQILDAIPKTRKKTMKKNSTETYDLSKETVKFLRHIDYCRLRKFDLRCLLSYEISPTPFYLVKDGLMRKPNKSDLVNELKKLASEVTPLSTLPPSS